jgi:hypothetical protein
MLLISPTMMKIVLLLTLIALAAVTGSNAHEHSVALRGSESVRVDHLTALRLEEEQMDDESSASGESATISSSDQYEEMEADQCTKAPELSDQKKKGMSLDQACRSKYMSKHMTVAYTCSNNPGYACCKSTAGSSVSTAWGKCRKAKKRSDDGDEMISMS